MLLRNRLESWDQDPNGFRGDIRKVATRLGDALVVDAESNPLALRAVTTGPVGEPIGNRHLESTGRRRQGVHDLRSINGQSVCLDAAGRPAHRARLAVVDPPVSRVQERERELVRIDRVHEAAPRRDPKKCDRRCRA